MFKVPSDIIYPAGLLSPPRTPSRHTGFVYLTVCRLDDTKEIEYDIAAGRMNVPFKDCLGQEPIIQYVHDLRSLAGPTVEFWVFRTIQKSTAL